jgi:Flp pilus assembly protein TadG
MQSIKTERRRERGVAMLTTLVALTALIACAALALDAGMMFVGRTQAQNVADGAALAAAQDLIDKSVPAVTLGAAEAAAIGIGTANSAVANAGVTIQPADIVYGNWDLATRTFDTGVDLTDPSLVTAVQVTPQLTDASPNNPVPAFMARILGLDHFDVSASAVAYLGFAGKFNRGELDLPIAIDCCKLKGDNCEDDYCATIATPPNECALVENPAFAGETTSCLEFHNTSEQNACWTQFDGEDPSINSTDLTDLVETGSTFEVGEDPIHVDNGTKTPVIKEIKDRFFGNAPYGDPAGANADHPDGDYYPGGTPGVPDSWVVRLPVVECQTDSHCGGGDPMQVVGAVCFEIREITVTPDKIIRGTFMCPSHPRWDECDLGITGSGGLDFSIRADLPVLVR